MPDPRSNQAVAERLDINLERWPNPLFRRRRWLTLFVGLLPALLVGVYAARNDQTIYHARPVSTGHQLWRNDCGKCHKTPWQPLVRLSTFDNSARSVREQDCRQCHTQRSDDHHKGTAAASYPDCAACHKEHQGQRRLADVADRFCLDCHRDLQQAHPGRISFVARLESFELHPPFALHRGWEQDPRAAGGTTDDFPGDAHRVRDNVRLEERQGQWQWTDKAKLEFSHRRHLERHLKQADLRPNDETARNEFRKLDCANCHEPDAAGHYMKPIVYEEHCASCHPLKYSSKLLGRGQDESLPHETAAIVHGVLRDRLTAFARQNPEEVRGTTTGVSRLPNKRPPTPQEEWEFVEEQLALIETAVFQRPQSDESPRNNACQKCHELIANQEEHVSPLLFKIAPPQIPQRWLHHSRFRHNRHRELTCVHCHHTQSAEPEILHGQSAAITLESETVKDVLIPSIQICQQCHGTSRGSATAGRAQSSCVECHQYHDPHNSQGNVGRSLQDILPTANRGFQALID